MLFILLFDPAFHPLFNSRRYMRFMCILIYSYDWAPNQSCNCGYQVSAFCRNCLLKGGREREREIIIHFANFYNASQTWLCIVACS